jgi:hypothetical protein
VTKTVRATATPTHKLSVDHVDGAAVTTTFGAEDLPHPFAVDYQWQAKEGQREEQDD